MRLGQASPARATTRLRALLKEPAPLILPGCFNAMSARILEHAGFPALYMSGYGTSLNLLGLPDAGLITLTEMALNAKLIASAVRAPLIADADTGFGNAINVVRTVEEYIRAGVAGMHLEDQVAPKRCGHVAGREVIAREEAVLHHETYSTTKEKALRASYDEKLADYSKRYEMAVDNWSQRVISRIGSISALRGRDGLKAALRSLGFPLK